MSECAGSHQPVGSIDIEDGEPTFCSVCYVEINAYMSAIIGGRDWLAKPHEDTRLVASEWIADS